MYTSNSKYVSETNKTNIINMVQEMRPYVSKLARDARGSNYSNGVILMGSEFIDGSRYGNDEQVFQSFCQKFVNSEQEAKALDEAVKNIDTFRDNVIQALVNAGSCDHWYLYEKSYE
jgi:hypothetical protein